MNEPATIPTEEEMLESVFRSQFAAGQEMVDSGLNAFKRTDLTVKEICDNAEWCISVADKHLKACQQTLLSIHATKLARQTQDLLKSVEV